MGKRSISGAAIGGAVALVLVACGESAVDAVADAMVATADAIEDVAEGVRDAASDGARAQPSADVACDELREGTVAAAGATTHTRWLFATVRDPAITRETLRGVDVLRCDRDRLPATSASCPAGATCTGELAPGDPGLPCQAGGAVYVDDGVVTVPCGYELTHRTAEGVETVSRDIWRSIRVSIRY